MNPGVDRKWLLIGGIGAAVLVVIAVVAIVVATGGSSDAGTAASDAEIEEVVGEVEDAEVEELETCLILWNAEPNASARQTVSVMQASYASLTFSATYPDKCLVTAANPKLDLAAQFLLGELEGEEGEMFTSFDQVHSGSASALDPSLTNWNVSIGREGTFSLSP